MEPHDSAAAFLGHSRGELVCAEFQSAAAPRPPVLNGHRDGATKTPKILGIIAAAPDRDLELLPIPKFTHLVGEGGEEFGKPTPTGAKPTLRPPGTATTEAARKL